MADAQLKLSRRALLAAACAAPLVRPFDLAQHRLDPGLRNSAAMRPVRSERSRGPLPSGAEAPHRKQWNRAFSALSRAEAAVAALEGTPDDDAFSEAAETLDRALERLLLAPAPDIAALATKLSLARRHQAWELPAGDALMAALEQDAHRLAAGES